MLLIATVAMLQAYGPTTTPPPDIPRPKTYWVGELKPIIVRSLCKRTDRVGLYVLFQAKHDLQDMYFQSVGLEKDWIEYITSRVDYLCSSEIDLSRVLQPPVELAFDASISPFAGIAKEMTWEYVGNSTSAPKGMETKYF